MFLAGAYRAAAGFDKGTFCTKVMSQVADCVQVAQENRKTDLIHDMDESLAKIAHRKTYASLAAKCDAQPMYLSSVCWWKQQRPSGVVVNVADSSEKSFGAVDLLRETPNNGGVGDGLPTEA